jgi:hypothetical protein
MVPERCRQVVQTSDTAASEGFQSRKLKRWKKKKKKKNDTGLNVT